jgi:hypothetical protein
VGTKEQNEADKELAGTKQKGDAHYATKHSDQTIKEALELLKTHSPAEVAAELKLRVEYVREIKNQGKRPSTYKRQRVEKRKLTVEQVRDVRMKLRQPSPPTQRSLAKLYNVSPSTICNMMKGKKYKHIKDDEESQHRYDAARSQEYIQRTKERLESLSTKEFLDEKQKEPAGHSRAPLMIPSTASSVTRGRMRWEHTLCLGWSSRMKETARRVLIFVSDTCAEGTRLA